MKLVKALSLCLGLATAGLPLSALADLVVIVKADSGVSSLEKSEVARIFLGRSNTFPNGDRVVPVNQAEQSDARTSFDFDLLGKSLAQMKAYWAKQSFSGRGSAPDELAGDAAVIDAVSGDAALIGYVDSAAVTSDVKIVFTVN